MTADLAACSDRPTDFLLVNRKIAIGPSDLKLKCQYLVTSKNLMVKTLIKFYHYFF